MNYIKAHNFYLETIGKKIDVDGRYGNQCVDLFKYYLSKIGYPNSTRAIGGTGYADELWKRRDALGYNVYFDYVTDISKLQDGDWCLWSFGSRTCPNSHVAMFRLNNGNGTGTFLGQNQGGRLESVDQRNFSYDGIIGALRLKQPAKQYKISYQAHVEGIGWQGEVGDGETAGTSGKSLRLEALKINLQNANITVKAHISNLGWRIYNQITKDTIIGTTGQSLAIEDLCISSNVPMEFRVHIKGTGWTNWTKADGIATLGTVGQALQLEAIEMRVK